MFMDHAPDMNRIGSIVRAWRLGIILLDEAKERLEWIMEPANHLPEVEQIPEPQPFDPEMMLVTLRRIEQKLNLVIQIQGIELPMELNPAILTEEARQLALENLKIEAVKIHRDQTGAGLAEAKQALDQYLARNRRSGNDR